MADVAADLKSWSTTASSNTPTDNTTIGGGLADNLQEIQKVVRQDLAHKGADIASGATTDLGAVPGLMHDITGTTTITSFGTVVAGIWKIIKFEGALTLTHNATSLILPSGANITTANGDVAIVFSEGSGNWRCISYQKADGSIVGIPLSLANGGTGVALADPGADRIVFWDESEGAIAFLTVGRGLSISTTSITAGMTLGTAQDSTSGTEIDFTSIPSGTKQITISLVGVSLGSAGALAVQIGDTDGIENSGYLSGNVLVSTGAGTASTATASFVLTNSAADTNIYHGCVFLTLVNAAAFTWAATWNLVRQADGFVLVGAGSKSLSAELDRVRITTTTGTPTFDAGSINIAYL